MINDLINSIYWEAVSGITVCLDVLITAVLTFIIIKQTRKLSQQQSALEARVSEQQNILQKRQLKVDIFPYKRQIYLNLCKVLEFSHFLTEKMLTLELEEKSMSDLYDMYVIAQENLLGDVKVITDSLREAEYILPKNISDTVLDINRQFDGICSKFIVFGTLGNVLPKEMIKETIKQNISSIREESKFINSKVNFIFSIMPRELDISKLDL